MTSANVSHKNNFDFLRLLFATSVIITHSFALSGLSEWQMDPMSRLTNGQATLSYFGVRGFFIVSGYLIFISLKRSKNVVDYFWKRIIRIYPGLIVVLLLTVILAVIPYPYGIRHYLNNPSVSNYFFNNLSIYKIQYSIDGLFADNPVKGAINGSLWTIPYECFFYILLSLLLLLKRGLDKYVVIFTFLILLNLFFYKNLVPWTFLYLDSKYIIELGTFFIAGSVLATLEIEKSKYKKPLFAFAFALLLISMFYSNFQLFQFFSLPLLVVLFGQSSTKYISDISHRIGDLSYGIYIYAYPVQQTLEHYFKLNYLALMICSIPITYILGYLSWHLVEKRALRLKSLHFLPESWKTVNNAGSANSTSIPHKQEAEAKL